MTLRFHVSSKSEQGPRSEQNDRVLTCRFPGGLLAAVMDGVGKGPGAGQAASEVRDVLEAQAMGVGPLAGWDMETEQPMHLDMAMMLAMDALADVDGATTCSALVLREGGLAVAAHCGDTALFRWRQGTLRLLTTPHRIGRHMLTRAMHGYGPAPHRAAAEYEVLTLDSVEPGDVYLLASDGCYESITESVLKVTLAQAAPADETRMAAVLVAASLAWGTRDNSSAIVVSVEGA